MFKKFTKIPMFSLVAVSLVGLPAGAMAEEFDEFEPFIEINATDGDIGYHVLLDGEAWKVAKIFDADGDRMFKGKGTDDLEEQGITEIFMESAEPPCWFEEANDEVDWYEDEVVDLEEFIDRFEEGTYTARGRTLEGERLRAEAEFTHNIPAAPETRVEVVDRTVTIHFSSGTDLGQCEYPADLIPNPADVEVVRWEVVLEPNEDELPGGELPDGLAFAVFTIQLPASENWMNEMSVVVPQVYVDAYLGAEVNQFKYEVGAKEESGNQTFTEATFEIEIED